MWWPCVYTHLLHGDMNHNDKLTMLFWAYAKAWDVGATTVPNMTQDECRFILSMYYTNIINTNYKPQKWTQNRMIVANRIWKHLKKFYDVNYQLPVALCDVNTLAIYADKNIY